SHGDPTAVAHSMDSAPACRRLDLNGPPGESLAKSEWRAVILVERSSALRRTISAERQLFDLGFGRLQQPIAMIAQRLAPLVDRNAFFKLDIATLEPADNGLKLFERPLERHVLDVGEIFGRCFGCRHVVLP